MNSNKKCLLFTIVSLFICNAVSAAPNWGGIGSNDDGWALIFALFIIPLPTALILSYISMKKSSRVLNVLARVFTGMLWFEGLGHMGSYSLLCSGVTALCIGMLVSKVANRNTGSKFALRKILIIILYLFAAKFIVAAIFRMTSIERYFPSGISFNPDWIYYLGFLLFQIYLLYRFTMQLRTKNMQPYGLLQLMGIGLLTGLGSWIISPVFLSDGLAMILSPLVNKHSLLYVDVLVWLSAGLAVYVLNNRKKNRIVER